MRAAFTAIGLTCLLMLGGCGFAPLYAQQGVTSSLAQIDIDVPQTRTGYFLEQDLRNGFGEDLTSAKAYTLNVTMNEEHYAVGYKVDETSTRSEITSTVTYKLSDNASGKTLYQNKFTETVTYDTSRSPFTGVISQENAQQRVATSISEKIQSELALYFHGDAPGQGSTSPQGDSSSSSSAPVPSP